MSRHVQLTPHFGQYIKMPCGKETSLAIIAQSSCRASCFQLWRPPRRLIKVWRFLQMILTFAASTCCLMVTGRIWIKYNSPLHLQTILLWLKSCKFIKLLVPPMHAADFYKFSVKMTTEFPSIFVPEVSVGFLYLLWFPMEAMISSQVLQ